jgi:LisH domain-containing protein ARMC9
MIELDVISWVVALLKDSESLNSFVVEYATALLLNLSLRSEGKTKCEAKELRVLDVLNELLEHDLFQVRTHVHGILYAILSRRVLKERARSMVCLCRCRVDVAGVG